MARTAECMCGQLRAVCEGEPVRNSVCHCLFCKRRTGSAFSNNATYPAAQVRSEGEYRTYTSTSEEGTWGKRHHCPTCGSTVFYEIEVRPGMISVPVGGFADPDFPAPAVQIFKARASSWCTLDVPWEDEA